MFWKISSRHYSRIQFATSSCPMNAPTLDKPRVTGALSPTNLRSDRHYSLQNKFVSQVSIEIAKVRWMVNRTTEELPIKTFLSIFSAVLQLQLNTAYMPGLIWWTCCNEDCPMKISWNGCSCSPWRRQTGGRTVGVYMGSMSVLLLPVNVFLNIRGHHLICSSVRQGRASPLAI